VNLEVRNGFPGVVSSLATREAGRPTHLSAPQEEIYVSPMVKSNDPATWPVTFSVANDETDVKMTMIVALLQKQYGKSSIIVLVIYFLYPKLNERA
jgi:hypothetical protein